ncbi:DoxX [Trypanosoma grayi]|uniref:DoxX n=1 Tax=Trypanosoma grayi TaxID=71804 RepID=UPI0004F45D7E|nr:DoxX [Trypanosoma grayi]KEG13555.1 DoxX [Trypanosoma grayi]
MTLRGGIRYIGLVLILIVYIASGLQNISNPSVSAALLAKSNFSKMLQMMGVDYTLRAADYTAVVQATGAVFLGFSLFILLGVGRCFFAFMLALATAVVTVTFHVNLENPLRISDNDLFHCMKNISVIGALLFVAGSGHRTHRYTQACQEVQAAKKNR